MINIIDTIFLKHPRENNMTYFQHMCFSFSIGTYFCVACNQAYIHGCFPCCFETSSSDCSIYIQSMIQKRNIH